MNLSVWFYTYCIPTYLLYVRSLSEVRDSLSFFHYRQGMAPVLEMAMVAKLLMILIDTTMMWDVPKKRPDKLHHGKVAVYSA